MVRRAGRQRLRAGAARLAPAGALLRARGACRGNGQDRRSRAGRGARRPAGRRPDYARGRGPRAGGDGGVLMLLAVDVGNTNVKLGVYDGRSLLASWRLTTRREQTADEYGVFTH